MQLWKRWATSLIFKKLPIANCYPTGENSPNLVTLLAFVFVPLTSQQGDQMRL
jgi:hypothetical protein